jgi:hypothetical protein
MLSASSVPTRSSSPKVPRISAMPSAFFGEPLPTGACAARRFYRPLPGRAGRPYRPLR